MRNEYRRRVQLLVELKQECNTRLNDLKDIARTSSWAYRILTANNRLDEQIAYQRLLHAVNMALLRAHKHYWWEYTVASNLNPFKVPDYIEVTNIKYGVLFKTTRVHHLTYTTFMK